MITHVMVNTATGWKWITQKEYLVNCLLLTPSEADAYIKNKAKKYVENS
jgi:hypothetical protein